MNECIITTLWWILCLGCSFVFFSLWVIAQTALYTEKKHSEELRIFLCENKMAKWTRQKDGTYKFELVR